MRALGDGGGGGGVREGGGGSSGTRKCRASVVYCIVLSGLIRLAVKIRA